jgi:hypothetical protein
MTSFRGLGWIYDVTTADENNRARARAFARRIVGADAEIGRQPPHDAWHTAGTRHEDVRANSVATPPVARRNHRQPVLVTSVTPPRRQTRSHLNQHLATPKRDAERSPHEGKEIA